MKEAAFISSLMTHRLGEKSLLETSSCEPESFMLSGTAVYRYVAGGRGLLAEIVDRLYCAPSVTASA